MRTFEEKATVVEKFEVVAKYLEEVCKVDNTDVEKSITVKRN